MVKIYQPTSKLLFGMALIVLGVLLIIQSSSVLARDEMINITDQTIEIDLLSLTEKTEEDLPFDLTGSVVITEYKEDDNEVLNSETVEIEDKYEDTENTVLTYELKDSESIHKITVEYSLAVGEDEYEDILNYQFITEQTAEAEVEISGFDNPYKESIILGTQITLVFPKGLSNPNEAKASLVDEDGNPVLNWNLASLNENKCTATVSDSLEGGKTYSIVLEDCLFTEYDHDWSYTIPETSYTFRAAPTAPKVTVSTSGKSNDAVKAGDVITLSIEGNYANTTVTVNGTNIQSSGTNQYIYVVPDNLADQSSISWSVSVSDEFGNPSASTNGDGIIYYAPITASAWTDKDKVLIGESVTLSWKTNHAVSTTGSFLDQEVNTSDSSITYVVPSVADQSKLGYTLDFEDKAGNTLTVTDMSVLVFAPLSASDVQFSPSSGYVKDGDTARLSFRVNHPATYSGSIAGQAVSGEASPGAEISVRIADLVDGSMISYEIVMTDSMGQTLVINGNGATYYAPISVTASTSHTYSKTQGYVKSGDSLYAKISGNHDVQITSANFSGQGADINGNSASCVVSGISDGNIVFHAEVTDAAGNTAEISESMNVICDNTAPKVTISNVNMFSNDDVRITLVAEDDNLDSAKFYLNGQETQGTSSGNSATWTLTIKDESSYTFNAKAEDKAGNTAETSNGQVIIDKTDPTITNVKIDSGDDSVYPSGTTLSDFFTINDTYLNNVEATIERANGTIRSVTLYDELADEGKQTARISANDMAGNSAKIVSYTYYIDATAPVVLASLQGSKSTMSEDSKTDVNAGDQIDVKLDEIWMGSEDPDHFETISVKLKDGTVKSVDLKNDKKNEVAVTIPENATELMVSAVDDVGNKTENVSYKLVTSQKSASTTSTIIPDSKDTEETGKTGIVLGLLSCAVSGFILALVFIVLRKRNILKH